MTGDPRDPKELQVQNWEKNIRTKHLALWMGCYGRGVGLAPATPTNIVGKGASEVNGPSMSSAEYQTLNIRSAPDAT